MTVLNLVSLAGIAGLLCIAWLFSEHRATINCRVIIWGMGLQFLFATLVFLFPPGVSAFLWLNSIVVSVMETAGSGAQFVFGRLAYPPGTVGPSGDESLGFFFAFQGLPTIIFFSALMSILYFAGVMPRLVRAFARVFTRLLRISGAEALCASSNIFVGIESTMTVRPHLATMTRSELSTVLTVGMATVASNILAVYVFSLQSVFPTIAAHLISASFLSAPAAIIMSKILVPERETPKTLGINIHPSYTRDSNLLIAIVSGANAGVRLIVGIVALLIAVLGLVSLTDLVLAGIGAKVNTMAGLGIDWSLQGLSGYLFYPLTLLLGVHPSDAVVISRIIGERLIVTEIPAYQDLALAIGNDLLIDPRSGVICAYALCGFAHIASLAIFIGGISAVAPETTGTLSEIGLRSLLAATLACLMTACIAGVFFLQGSILIG